MLERGSEPHFLKRIASSLRVPSCSALKRFSPDRLPTTESSFSRMNGRAIGKKRSHLLSRLLSGQTGIAGQNIKAGCTFSDLEHRPSISFGMGTGGWSGWEMRSLFDPGPNLIEPYLHNSLLAFGLRPYRGGNQAINDWVFDLPTDNPGGDVPYTNYLVTFLPDTRARIVSALWTPGKLNLGLEINIPSEHRPASNPSVGKRSLSACKPGGERSNRARNLRMTRASC